MYQKLFLIYFRNLKIIKDPKTFQVFMFFIMIIFLLISMFITLFLRNYFITIFMSLLLFQYNIPLFTKSVLDLQSIHFFYKRKIIFKYLCFELFKYNPLIVFYLMFVIVEFAISIFFADWLNVIIIIIGVLLNLALILNKFITSKYLKGYMLLIYLSCIFILLFKANLVWICISLILLVFYIYLSFNNIQLTYALYKDISSEKRFNYWNKYFLYTYLYIKRSHIKPILFNFLIIAIYILFQVKTKSVIDYSFILAIQYLVEIELLADYKFKHIDSTTAQYYVFNSIKLRKIKKFMLTEYFSQFIIFSIIVLIAGGISAYLLSYQFALNALLTLPILFVLGYIYFSGESMMVQKRKKFNNIIIQYCIFVFLIIIYIVKGALM